MNCSNSKKTTNKGNTSNKGKSLLIVNPIFLSISLGNKTSLIQFNSAIVFGFDLVDPFTTNGKFTTRQINQISSVSFLQSLKFLNYCLLPKRISTSLTIGVRSREAHDGKAQLKNKNNHANEQEVFLPGQIDERGGEESNQ